MKLGQHYASLVPIGDKLRGDTFYGNNCPDITEELGFDIVKQRWRHFSLCCCFALDIPHSCKQPICPILCEVDSPSVTCSKLASLAKMMPSAAALTIAEFATPPELLTLQTNDTLLFLMIRGDPPTDSTLL